MPDRFARAIVKCTRTHMEEIDDKDWSERFVRAQTKPGAARIFVGVVIIFFKVIFKLTMLGPSLGPPDLRGHSVFDLAGMLLWFVGFGLIVSGLLARKVRVAPERE
jgi:hypothetical protein